MEKLYISDKYECPINGHVAFIKYDDSIVPLLTNIRVEKTGLTFSNEKEDFSLDDSIRLDIRLIDFGILHCYFKKDGLDKKTLFKSVKALKTKVNDYFSSYNKLLKTFDVLKEHNPIVLFFENCYNVDFIEDDITKIYTLDCPILFEAHPRPADFVPKIDSALVLNNISEKTTNGDSQTQEDKSSKVTIHLSEETKDLIIDFAILSISSLLCAVSLVGTIIFLLTNNAMSVLFILLTIASSLFAGYIGNSMFFIKKPLYKTLLMYGLPVIFTAAGMGIAYAIFQSKIPAGTSPLLLTLLPIGIALALEILMTFVFHIVIYIRAKLPDD